MYTKTGFSVLAAAGVIGMTMGGAQGATTSCVPSGAATPTTSPSSSRAARNASIANGSDNAASNANDATGAAGPRGPQGPAGGTGTDGNGNGTGPLGGEPTGPTGPSGATGSHGLNGLHVDVRGDTTDNTTGSATVTNNGSTVPNTSGSHAALLDLRARSNATSTPTTGGTYVTGRSSLTGPRPIVSVHPGR